MSRKNDRHAYGLGSLEEHRGSWYGRWRVNGRQVRRKVGAIRQRGSTEGLTRKQAEGVSCISRPR